MSLLATQDSDPVPVHMSLLMPFVYFTIEICVSLKEISNYYHLTCNT